MTEHGGSASRTNAQHARHAKDAQHAKDVEDGSAAYLVVPPGLRPLATGLAVVCAVLLAALGLTYRDSSQPGAFDGGVAAALRSVWPEPGPLFYVVDGLVTLAPVLLVIGLLVAASLLLGLRRLALVALLGPFCVAGATTALKPVVDRTIHGDNLSFPSGHTGYATAVGLVLGLLLVGLARRATAAWRAVLLLAPALLTGGVMAFDQTTMEAHYLTDSLGGACTAVVVVLALALLVDRVLDRAARRRPREGDRAALAEP